MVLVAIALACLIVICLGGGVLIWAMLKALKANSEIYKIRRRAAEARHASGLLPPLSGLFAPRPSSESSAGSRERLLLSGPIVSAETGGPGGEHLVGSSPRRSFSRRKLVRRLVAAYAALLVAGFAVGYLLATGSQEKRLVVGLIGTFGAMFLVGVASEVLLVGVALRTTWRDRPK